MIFRYLELNPFSPRNIWKQLQEIWKQLLNIRERRESFTSRSTDVFNVAIKSTRSLNGEGMNEYGTHKHAQEKFEVFTY